MHINAKYYVISIGSIFISLGVGMLVGFNLNYDEEFSKQQASIINDLDTRFEKLRDTNNDLKLKLENSTEAYNNIVTFVDSNAYKLLSEELSNYNIGVISTGINNTTEYVENAISSANGNLLFNINLTDKVLDNSVLAELSKEIEIEITDTEKFIDYVLNILKNNSAKDKLKHLEDLGLIKVRSLDSNYSNYSSVVLSGDEKSKNFDALDKVLIEKLKYEDKHVVAVETLNTEASSLEKYSENKVATINNINENAGQLSLVLALKDKNTVGNFGKGENCESLMPYNK